MRRNILNVTTHMHRWKLSALAAAAFVSAAMTTTDAAALALGPLNVQSALGENLRAEIAIPQATSAELSSLVAQIASPEVFRAQGLDYSGSAAAIQLQLLRKPDGTASLRLSSNTPLQDPFVDLVVETHWSTGHLVRSYTLLLDPPAAQRPLPSPDTAAQVPPAAPASITGKSYSSNHAPRPSAAVTATAPAPSVASAPAASLSKLSSATPLASAADTARVRKGDTAGRIANANRPSGVSLDQMLVAMLRSNPDAFINGNVNRVRAGAVLQMPSKDQALATSASEARQIVAAQSRDFNAYRRSLASKAPHATVQAADRSSSGRVQAQVADTRPAADTADKLTLSKGSVQNAAIAEEKLAAAKQAVDQDNRLNELQRNLAELNALAGNSATTVVTAPTTDAQAATSAAPTEPAAPATPEVPALEVSNTAAAAAENATQSAAPKDTPLETPATEAAASTPATTASTATQAPATSVEPSATSTPTAAQASEPSPTSGLLDNPLVPAGAGLLALLLGLLGYGAWKRRHARQPVQDPSMGDSQLHPDSFFGDSGGQHIDTSSADSGASTIAYATSQLDGAGDVDPVAEADVYLAYGRDVQAEEILKEALRNQPERLAVHVKLAEIYVKRQDIEGLESVARGLQAVSHAQGPEWQRVMDMGRHMAPSHPFFAAPETSSATAFAQPASGLAAALNAFTPSAPAASLDEVDTSSPVAQSASNNDLNLDLPDESLGNTAATAAPDHPATPPSDADFSALELPATLERQVDDAAAVQAQDQPTLVQDTLMPEDGHTSDDSGLDLDLSGFEIPAAATASAPTEPTPDTALDTDHSLDLPAPAITADPEPTSGEQNSVDEPDVPADLEFDLGSLDLDLGPIPEPATDAQPVHNLADDPLSTKLDLAQEFNAIGDSEGARALIEEVLAEASGSLKERAQKMLSELD